MAPREIKHLDDLNFGPDGKANGIFTFDDRTGTAVTVNLVDGVITGTGVTPQLRDDVLVYLNKLGAKRGEKFFLTSGEIIMEPQLVSSTTGFASRILGVTGIRTDHTFSCAGNLTDGRQFRIVRGEAKLESAPGSGVLAAPGTTEVEEIARTLVSQKVGDILAGKKEAGVVYVDTGSGKIKLAEFKAVGKDVKARIEALKTANPTDTKADIELKLRTEFPQFYATDPAIMGSIAENAFRSIDRMAKAKSAPGKAVRAAASGTAKAARAAASGTAKAARAAGRGIKKNTWDKAPFSGEGKFKSFEKRENLITEINKQTEALTKATPGITPVAIRSAIEANLKSKYRVQYHTFIDLALDRAFDSEFMGKKAKKFVEVHKLDEIILSMRSEKKTEKEIKDALNEKLEDHDLSDSERKNIIEEAYKYAESIPHRAWLLAKKIPVKKALATTGIVGAIAIGGLSVGLYKGGGWVINKAAETGKGAKTGIKNGWNWGANKAHEFEKKPWKYNIFRGMLNLGGRVAYRAQQAILAPGGALVNGGVGLLKGLFGKEVPEKVYAKATPAKVEKTEEKAKPVERTEKEEKKGTKTEAKKEDQDHDHDHEKKHLKLSSDPSDRVRLWKAITELVKAPGEDKHLEETIDAFVDATDLDHKIPLLGFAGSAVVALKRWAWKHEEIQGIEIDYPHLGKQMRNLNKDKRNSFLKALDMEEVNDKFNHLQSEERFKQALKSDSGPKELEHQVEALFGRQGPYNEADLKKYAKELLAKIGEDKDISPKLTEKRAKLVKYIKWVRDLLLKDDCKYLKAAFHAEKEKTLPPINYDEFGKFIFENVHDDTDIASFNKMFKKRVFEGNFRLLLDEARFDKALKSDTEREAARKQVYSLFDESGAPDVSDIIRQADALKANLKLTASPAAAGSLQAMIEETVRILSRTDAMNKLFEGIMTVNWEDMGNEAMAKVNTPAQQRSFISAYVEANAKGDFDFKHRYVLTPAAYTAAVADDENREEAKKQLYGAFGLSGKVDRATVTSRAKVIRTTLGLETTPPPVPGSPEGDLREKLVNIENTVKAAGELEKLFPKAAPAETVIAFDPDKFGDQVFDEINPNKPEDRKGYLRSFKPKAFKRKFAVLMEQAALKNEAKKNPEKIKELLKVLFDYDFPVNDTMVANFFVDLKDQVKDPTGYTSDPELASNYKEFNKCLSDTEAAITGAAVLADLYTEKTEKPKMDIDYKHLARTMNGLSTPKLTESFLESFDDKFAETRYPLLLDENRMEKAFATTKGREQIRDSLMRLYGLEGKVTVVELQAAGDEMIAALQPAVAANASLAPKQAALKAILEKALLSPGTLEAVGAKKSPAKSAEDLLLELYEEEPVKITPKYETFGAFMDSLEEEDKIRAMLRGYSSIRFRNNIPLWNQNQIEEDTKSEPARTELMQALVRFLRPTNTTKRFTQGGVATIIDSYIAKVKPEVGTSLDLQAKAFITDMEAVKTALDTAHLKLIYEGPPAIKTPVQWAKFGQQLQALRPEQVPSYLRDFDTNRAKFGQEFIDLLNPPDFRTGLKPAQRRDIQKQLNKLFNLTGEVTSERAQFLINAMQSNLNTTDSTVVSISRDLKGYLAAIQNNVLKPGFLGKVYERKAKAA